MKKREGFLLLSVLLALFGYIFFFLGQVFPSIYQGFNKVGNSIAGNAIADIKVPYINLDLTLLIIISQGIILGFIIFAIVMRTMKNKNQKKEKINLGSFSLKKTKSQTDLDILYNIIKTKKKVSIEALSLYFNISQEKALEWAKILENEEMVTIDYPFLSNPEITFSDKNNTSDEPISDKPIKITEDNNNLKEKDSKVNIINKKIEANPPIKIVENKKNKNLIKIETNKVNNKENEAKVIINEVNNDKTNLTKKPNKLFSFFKRKDKVVNNPVINKPLEKVSKNNNEEKMVEPINNEKKIDDKNKREDFFNLDKTEKIKS